MHILIVGEPGAGKTSLINRVLQDVKQPIFGFRTEKGHKEVTGSSRIYIHRASGPKAYSDENTVGICSSGGAETNSGVFDSLGVSFLTGIPQDGIVLMDELGVLESTEPVFCNIVKSILDGPYFVIAAIKTKETPFLQSVRSHYKAQVYNLTTENREILYEQIMSDIRRSDHKRMV